tara:strand:- start:922 stop:1614 length:693 start_codon:yes stop_codon:yes gene_type:complete
MMDKQLTVEFPLFEQTLRSGAYETSLSTGYVPIHTNGNIFKYETTLDLGGYTRQDDMTVYFRRSFEQLGGSDFLQWNQYDPAIDPIYQQTIISSVPFTDEQLVSSLLVSPSFTPYADATQDFGNFNREHIIHGHYEIKYANSVVGASSFGSSGNATLISLADNYYSSLEPTAADTLYCYRVIALPLPTQSQITSAVEPAKRVIMDAYIAEEPTNEYLMRLKRSYELANQV